MHVGGETTPEVVTGTCDQTESKFSLEHEDGTSEEGTVGEELEDERRRDLVGSVGDADVEIGQLCLAKIADHDIQLALFGSKRRKERQSREKDVSVRSTNKLAGSKSTSIFAPAGDSIMSKHQGRRGKEGSAILENCRIVRLQSRARTKDGK